jgi:hypothetical protein
MEKPSTAISKACNSNKITSGAGAGGSLKEPKGCQRPYQDIVGHFRHFIFWLHRLQSAFMLDVNEG